MGKQSEKMANRAMVKVQIFNYEHPGDDIVVLDEFGKIVQIQDKAKVRVSQHVASALSDAITQKVIIENHKRRVEMVPRFIVNYLAEDAKLDTDGTDQSAVEDELVTSAVQEKIRKAENAPTPRGKKAVAKKIGAMA